MNYHELRTRLYVGYRVWINLEPSISGFDLNLKKNSHVDFIPT